MGATTMPRPQKPIALPRCSGGNVSSSTACDSGCRTPPLVPWMTRKRIRKGRLGATPQSSDAAVKPATDAISSRLRPNWWESQPASGRITAFATR